MFIPYPCVIIKGKGGGGDLPLTVYRRDYFTVKYFSGTSIWVDPMNFPGLPMI